MPDPHPSIDELFGDDDGEPAVVDEWSTAIRSTTTRLRRPSP